MLSFKHKHSEAKLVWRDPEMKHNHKNKLFEQRLKDGIVQ